MSSHQIVLDGVTFDFVATEIPATDEQAPGQELRVTIHTFSRTSHFNARSREDRFRMLVGAAEKIRRVKILDV